jgi:hypothetical protein
MRIAKRPSLTTGYTGPRAGERDVVSLDARLTVGEGAPIEVAVLDLDTRGCRVRGFTAAVTKLDPIALQLGDVGPIAARLRWAKRGSAGLRFDEPLSAEDVARAELSAVPAPVSRVVPLRRAAGESQGD